MTQPSDTPSRGKDEAWSDEVLRAKYLDYCSARVAEVLLRLSADDMYVLAQEVARESTGAPEGVPSFNTMVQRATERITAGLALPDFLEWLQEYERDPEKFEREMIGLWQSEVNAPDHRST